ncbi:P-loop containing nucleoside triphosphate hydrolase protein [Glomus cerebriforme]|uniref:P-loop containing nucleoside triphosphate hydrolase protein n=1 Tax=Glomus cerebriforme TaxID=658196 RepID=A0A397SR76_9GLOM|nr:P-loop containing nucleoside triphosphate hydrolase protein [Glomus cerebriforme]
MTEIKNLLIIGRTGNGKSTLANVLSNTENFSESSGSISKTKNFQSETFEWEGTNYRVFDTIGIGDTQLSKATILYRIAEGINAMDGGINQILFVVGGRFTQDEVDAFNLFRLVLHESHILEYTTLVRTKFTRFNNPDKCNEDHQALINENRDLVNSFRKIIYVDNPSIDTDDDDEKRINGNKRIQSRQILLNYLKDECQSNYELGCWSRISLDFSSYIGRKLELERENDEDSFFMKLENAKNELAQKVSSLLQTEIPSIKKSSWCSLL